MFLYVNCYKQKKNKKKKESIKDENEEEEEAVFKPIIFTQFTQITRKAFKFYIKRFQDSNKSE